MLSHRFSMGDIVAVLPRGSNAHIPPGNYTVTRLLPVSGPVCQVRIKHSAENFERVLDESQLRPV